MPVSPNYGEVWMSDIKNLNTGRILSPQPLQRNPADTFLTLEQAAKRGEMGVSTLRQALVAGKGPRAYKLPGSNRWRIFGEDFDAWATSNMASPGLPAATADDDPI
jgi:hypothetical protein